MKKTSLLLFTAILSVCLFTSCSGDDDSENNSTDIVGIWQMYEATPSSYYDSCDFRGWIEFEADGSYSEFDQCEGVITNGTWTISKKTITIIDDDFSIPMDFKIISISGDEMVLEIIFLGTHTAKYKRLN
ncbi:lipocalin family protein [Bacteroides sp. OttesenSCG-928-E20]|nr:lipocalin family protein [Bacteroides sp. OttesenSCG-928-E20]MDL2304235.1 lipocalin family protein [Bacteroides sp. OttesenSCG-928-D19]